MSEPTRKEQEALRQRIRDAADILERFVDSNGKLNATKMTGRIRELEAEVARLRSSLVELSSWQAHKDEHEKRLTIVREAIENAPCPIPSVNTGGPNCIGLRGCEKTPPDCRCWKREALEKLK